MQIFHKFSARKCPDLPRLSNGLLSTEIFEYGQNITFECFPGYQLQGNTEISCTVAGSWDRDMPQCIGKTIHHTSIYPGFPLFRTIKFPDFFLNFLNSRILRTAFSGLKSDYHKLQINYYSCKGNNLFNVFK